MRNAKKKSPQEKGKQSQMKIWIYIEEWRSFEMSYAINFTILLLHMRRLRFRKLQWSVVTNSTTIRTHKTFPRHTVNQWVMLGMCQFTLCLSRKIALCCCPLNDHFWEPIPVGKMIQNSCRYLTFHSLIPRFYEVCPISNCFIYLSLTIFIRNSAYVINVKFHFVAPPCPVLWRIHIC